MHYQTLGERCAEIDSAAHLATLVQYAIGTRLEKTCTLKALQEALTSITHSLTPWY